MDILKNLVSKLHNFMLQIEEFVNLFKILRVQVHQKKIHIQIRKKIDKLYFFSLILLSALARKFLSLNRSLVGALLNHSHQAQYFMPRALKKGTHRLITMYIRAYLT